MNPLPETERGGELYLSILILNKNARILWRLIFQQEFLSKAEENLKIAHISFERECYNACANRAYFAAFQAAIAALADKGCAEQKK